MRVICITNLVAGISEAEARRRIQRSVHMDGPITDLVVGREYAVQALGERDGGLWFYLHTVPMNDYPFPYPAEMFEIRDDKLPPGWSLRLQEQEGQVSFKFMSFNEWVSDDHFYESLLDGDTESVSIYRRCGRELELIFNNT